MKIFSVSGPMQREFGGPPMAVSGICKSLAQLGNEIDLYIFGQSKSDVVVNFPFFSKLEKAGVRIEVLHRRQTSKYGVFPNILQIRKLYSKIKNADVVIFHQVFQIHMIVLFPTLLMTRTPYIVMPHGSLTVYQRKQHSGRKKIPGLVINKFLQNAHAIFVATEQEAIELPENIRPSARVVGLGIDFNDQNYAEKREKPIFTLLFLGRIAQKKRLDIALKAFALALSLSEKKMRFVICGTGNQNEMSQMYKLTEELGVASNVEFRGWIDGLDKRRALLESDCFILTSEDENFAIAAAEALSAGVPCVLSSKVAISTLVQKHGAGVVFQNLKVSEIATSITNISSMDQNLLQRASKKAAREIQWDYVALVWEENLKEILKS
jgi:glycosyltransferase involved in cell wall biosynthesis